MAKSMKIDMEKLYGVVRRTHRIGAVAQKMGIQPETLSKKLRGDRSLRIDDLNKICQIIERDADEFVTFR